MTQKCPILFVFLFILLFFLSCYTITHPEPCPGLTEIDSSSETEMMADFTY